MIRQRKFRVAIAENSKQSLAGHQDAIAALRSSSRLEPERTKPARPDIRPDVSVGKSGNHPGDAIFRARVGRKLDGVWGARRTDQGTCWGGPENCIVPTARAEAVLPRGRQRGQEPRCAKLLRVRILQYVRIAACACVSADTDVLSGMQMSECFRFCLPLQQ